MTNINSNDDIGKINHIFKKESKVKKKEKIVAETKQVEASSLDALNSYGKANVAFKGIFKRKKKEEVLSASLIWNKLAKANISEKIKSSIWDSISYSLNTDEQLKIANRIVSTPILYENTNFQDTARDILTGVDNLENAKIKINLIDKFITNQELVNSNLKNCIGTLVLLTPEKVSEEQASNILSIPEIYHNTAISDLLNSMSCRNGSNKKDAVLKKFFSNPKLCANKEIAEQVALILNARCIDQGFEIAKTFLSDPNLYQNEWLDKNISSLVQFFDFEERGVLVEKFLSNPDLYNNGGLQENILDIIDSIAPQKQLGTQWYNVIEKAKYVDFFLSNSKLYTNELLQKNLKYVIDKTYSNFDPKEAEEFLNNYCILLKDGVDGQTAIKY